eukprot:jgi/Orpsp1_1/1186623/evm.model.d7180000052052.1
MKLVHPYLVDISVLAHQNYMITNIDQYNRIKTLVVSNQYKDAYNNSMVLNLLIMNKTFIDFYIYDDEFIGYLMHNDSNDKFVNYNYIRIIHKLVEYGYADKSLVKEFFTQNSTLTNSPDFTIINECPLFEGTQEEDLFSSYDKESIENCKELLNLHNYFYLSNGVEKCLKVLNEFALENGENMINEEGYRNLINFILANGGDVNSLGINECNTLDIVNLSKRNTFLLENINDINIIYFFQNNPYLFNKFDINSTYEKFPISFPIKIMKKYSTVFVNYINKNEFEYDNKYISELLNNCKNDEFIEILNNFGFINPDVIENLPLYHRKYISNYENFIKF